MNEDRIHTTAVDPVTGDPILHPLERRARRNHYAKRRRRRAKEVADAKARAKAALAARQPGTYPPALPEGRTSQLPHPKNRAKNRLSPVLTPWHTIHGQTARHPTLDRITTYGRTA